MAKISIKKPTKKKPVKAGSSFKGGTGYPTAKLILITKDLKNK